jgi:methylphosphotriester-DNA--protein-cysteine methyltransferase
MDLDDDACYSALTTKDARFDGKFFSGVKTTGVYCRPICPARTPKRENVTFREPDAFPATDMGLLRAMSDASGHPVARRDLVARAERWRPWRAYAAHHLWSSTPTFSAARVQLSRP